jgi:HK97 family phage prohead protease
MERRAGIELRAVGRKLEGYAAVFNEETRVADFREIIRPGAFANTIKEGRDILALSDHDSSKVLARTKSGTLRLAEDSRGLHFSLDVPETSAGRDVLALAERGDIGGASFGFQVAKDGEIRTGNLRELRAIDLFEISIVSSWPAYDGTVVQARHRQNNEHAAFRRVLNRWRA